MHPWDQDNVSTDTSRCPCGLLRWCTRPMHDLFPSLIRTVGTAPDSYTTAPSKQSNEGDLFSWAHPRGHTKSKGTIARSFPFYYIRTHSSPSRLVQLQIRRLLASWQVPVLKSRLSRTHLPLLWLTVAGRQHDCRNYPTSHSHRSPSAFPKPLTRLAILCANSLLNCCRHLLSHRCLPARRLTKSLHGGDTNYHPHQTSRPRRSIRGFKNDYYHVDTDVVIARVVHVGCKPVSIAPQYRSHPP